MSSLGNVTYFMDTGNYGSSLIDGELGVIFFHDSCLTKVKDRMFFIERDKKNDA